MENVNAKWENKMYEVHSIIGDILYDAERGKISWKDACYQAQAELSDLNEIEESNEFHETVYVEEAEIERLHKILDMSYEEAEKEGIKKGSKIKTFSKIFENGFMAEVSVCFGNHNAFVEATLFNEEYIPLEIKEIEDEINGVYEFYYAKDIYKFDILVGDILTIEVSEEKLIEVKKLLEKENTTPEKENVEDESFIMIERSDNINGRVAEFELYFQHIEYLLGLSLFDKSGPEHKLLYSLEGINKKEIDKIIEKGETFFELEIIEEGVSEDIFVRIIKK